jgi:hypothetical protein
MCIAPHPQVKKVAQAAAASRSVAALIVSEQQGSAAATSEGENGAGSSAAPHKRQKRTHGEHNQRAQGNGSGDSLQQVSFQCNFSWRESGHGLAIFSTAPHISCMHACICIHTCKSAYMHAYSSACMHTYAETIDLLHATT